MNFSEYIQSPISKEIIHDELERSFIFYKNLSADLKQRFVERTSVFIVQKKFVARQNILMTDTIRIIISACAVQITLGLDFFTIDTFEYVIVYPDVYESPGTKRMHRGETNLNGFICLSWKHVLAGIENPSDNYNLGLHEWMHALRFNGINYDQTDYFFDGYINKWVANAMHDFLLLKNGKHSVFRRYGAVNIHEFLSVCTEHFFESTDEFKLNAPELFDQMCILLNQLPDKNGTSTIGVRKQLLGSPEVTVDSQQAPILILEASFFRTLLNLGLGLFYFGLTFIILLWQNSWITTIMALIVGLWLIVKMNNKYFTIKFYENNLYLQKGFATWFAQKLIINYRSLMKLEIYDGNYEKGGEAVFQLNYYNGSEFRKKIVYCSAIAVPEEKIMSLLQQKKVLVLCPK